MVEFVPFIPAALVVVIALVYTVFLRRPETWRTVAEGALKRMEFTEKTYRYRRGAMVHHTDYETVRTNTLHFEGGTVLYGIRGVLTEPGTVLVRLQRSSHGRHRLVRYE